LKLNLDSLSQSSIIIDRNEMNDYENEDNQSFSQELPSKIIVSSKLSKDEKNLSEEVKEWQEWKKLSLTEFKEF